MQVSERALALVSLLKGCRGAAGGDFGGFSASPTGGLPLAEWLPSVRFISLHQGKPPAGDASDRGPLALS
jgi:hypothetical protein